MFETSAPDFARIVHKNFSHRLTQMDADNLFRSCLKTQDFAHERHESDEKRIIILMQVLFFREFCVFRGQKIVFKQLLRFYPS